LGARVWLSILGICAGAVIAGWILFVAFGWMWATTGFFGALLALTVVAVGFGWFYDRREARRRGQLA
jgi:hypothetical protein